MKEEEKQKIEKIAQQLLSEEETTEYKSLDEQAIEQLLSAAQFISRGQYLEVAIGGKKWRIRATSMSQNRAMSNIDIDVMFWQKELSAIEDAKQAKAINDKIRKAYAKKAAHKVLGMYLRWIPLAHAYMWRRIYHSSEAVSATINATEAIGENKVFYLANLGSSKQALALSMKQVGDADKQRMQRGESAENMAEQDGLPKKEVSKSGAPSSSRRTTKK